MQIRGAVLESMTATKPYAESQPLKFQELELDGPGEHEVLVRMEAAGLCHSDLSVVDGNRPRPMPMLLGHEAAGRIEALGPAVTGFEIGDRVSMTFLPRCGECANCRTDGRLPCIPGSAANGAGTLLGGDMHLHRAAADGDELVYHHLGVSGFATHAVVDTRSIVKVGDDVPPEIAAVLGCAVLTGGGAVLNAGKPQPGDAVIVVGLGGVGMAALITALALDGLEVIGVDALDAKLAEATRLGAAAVYTPQGAEAAGIKAPVVIEAAGHPRAFETAVRLTAPGGTTVTVGLPAPTAESTVSPLGITAEARTITGSYLGSSVPARDIPRFVELWRAGKLPVEELISSRIRLDDLNAALDRLAAGEAVRQVILFD